MHDMDVLIDVIVNIMKVSIYVVLGSSSVANMASYAICSEFDFGDS
jgi:hypothetical protein